MLGARRFMPRTRPAEPQIGSRKAAARERQQRVQSLPFVAFGSAQTESTGARVKRALRPEKTSNIEWRYLGKSGLNCTYLAEILDAATTICAVICATYFVFGSGLKFRVSVVRFHPWPPSFKELASAAACGCLIMFPALVPSPGLAVSLAFFSKRLRKSPYGQVPPEWRMVL
jgi:hypothetical protein